MGIIINQNEYSLKNPHSRMLTKHLNEHKETLKYFVGYRANHHKISSQSIRDFYHKKYLRIYGQNQKVI